MFSLWTFVREPVRPAADLDQRDRALAGIGADQATQPGRFLAERGRGDLHPARELGAEVRRREAQRARDHEDGRAARSPRRATSRKARRDTRQAKTDPGEPQRQQRQPRLRQQHRHQHERRADEPEVALLATFGAHELDEDERDAEHQVRREHDRAAERRHEPRQSAVGDRRPRRRPHAPPARAAGGRPPPPRPPRAPRRASPGARSRRSRRR